MSIHLEAREIVAGCFEVTVPRLAGMVVANVRLNLNGEWSTTVLPSSFWMSAGVVAQFSDQTRGVDSLVALARWGGDSISIVAA